MKRILVLLALAMCALPLHKAAAASDPEDASGSKDPPLFNRMPGFHIYNYEELDFDRFEFPVGPDKKQTVEGRHFFADYYANEGIKLPSGLQIERNYTNAAKAIGGKVVYEYEDAGLHTTIKVVTKDAEVWVQLASGSNGMYNIHMVQKEGMKQEVTADAASLAGSIGETGKAAVYGIYFDTDKSTIKPASDAAIGEIANLLKGDAKLKLFVVGHTDNAGAFDHNLKLSQARAAAVVDALVSGKGVAAARLIAFGAGPTSPAASNKTEEGRAKNRRVELVAQ